MGRISVYIIQKRGEIMKTIYRMLKRDSKGFTLVELMVVLLIIGILVAIAIPIYNSTQENARLKACQSNLRTIDGAISQYQADGGDVSTLTDVGQLVPTYIKEVPKCPSGGTYSIDNGFAKCDEASHTY